MAKQLLKYVLVNGQKPSYIDDGGYWCFNNELMGVSVEDESQIPVGATFVSRADLESHVASMGLKHRGLNGDGAALTTQEQLDLIDSWLISRGIPNLA